MNQHKVLEEMSSNLDVDYDNDMPPGLGDTDLRLLKLMGVDPEFEGVVFEKLPDEQKKKKYEWVRTHVRPMAIRPPRYSHEYP